MTCARATALATLLAVSACGTQPQPPAAPASFTPTVLGEFGTPGTYADVHVIGAGGAPATRAEILELVVAWDRDADPLAASPRNRAGREPFFSPPPAGVVVERKVADANGMASLAFPVGLKACAYAYTDDDAGAGEAIAASLITRPENVYGYEVRLVPAVAVRGEVTDADGRPAAGATVRAAFRCGSDPGLVVLMTTCDSGGAFALPPVPAGTGGAASAVSLRADAPDETSVRRAATTSELRAGSVRLVLGR
jgi:hypothetical protein